MSLWSQFSSGDVRQLRLKNQEGERKARTEQQRSGREDRTDLLCGDCRVVPSSLPKNQDTAAEDRQDPALVSR